MINYIFYIEYEDRTRKLYNKFCIKPERTNLYKYIINQLNKDKNINSVGYSVASEYRN
jgi:hypothetical protein